MTLEKQSRDIIFQGLNEKVEPEVLPEGQLVQVDDAEFHRPGDIRKRRGYTALSKNKAGGGTIGAATKLLQRENELLLCDGETLWALNSDEDEWINRGSHTTMRTTTDLIYRGADYTADENSRVSVAYANGYYVWVFGTDYWVQEESTGAFVQTKTSIGTFSGGYAWARCVTLGNIVFIVYQEGTKAIKARRLDLTNPDSAGSTVTLATDGFNNDHEMHYDAIADSTETYLVLCYRCHDAVTGEGLAVGTYNAAGTLVDYWTRAAFANGGPITVIGSSATQFFFCYDRRAGLEVRCQLFTLATGAITAGADFQINNYAAANTEIRAMVGIGTGATTAVLFYDAWDSGSTAAQRIREAVLSTTPSAADSTLVLGASIAGRPFYQGTNYLFPVVWDSYFHDGKYLQSTYFLLDYTGATRSRYLVGRAGNASKAFAGNGQRTMTWSDYAEVSTGKYVFAAAISGQTYETDAGAGQNALNVTFGLSSVEFDFTKTGNYANINETTLIADGMLYNYDGGNINEQGFHLFPSQPLLSNTGGTAHNLTNGALYQWIVVYEYYDAKGQVYYSAPSQAGTHTPLAGHQILITMRTLRLTNKTATDVRLRVYRTIANGSVFYSETVIANTAAANTVTIDVGVVNDTYLITGPTLYTTGGVLDHIPPPAPLQLVRHDNRVFMISGDNDLYYSKARTEDSGIAFCDALRIQVDPEGGRLASLASMDGQLIIGKETRMLRMYGSGPTDTGQGGYSEPILIGSDFGCKYLNPMLATSEGLFVSSSLGLTLLHRDLSAEYIGAPVETSRGTADVIAINDLEDRAQIVFSLASSSYNLVYDTFARLWSRYTNHQMLGALVWKGLFTYATSAGQVYKQASTYLDGVTAIKPVIETGRLNLAGLQGYARLYWVHLLLRTHSTCNCKATLTYDDGTTDVFNFALSSIYQHDIRLKPSKQKQRNVKIKVEEVSAGGSSGGLGMIGVRLVYGTKRKYTRGPSYTK